MAKKQEMQSSKLYGNKPQISTQSHLDVAEVKQGTIVMKDGSLRAVVAISSTNFSLKNTDEQNALINAYQNFLNGLSFPIQILMQSRKLDINSYLEKLRAVMQEQTNELLRMQTQEYIEYVSKLIEFASIMDKNFYVVVPYSIHGVKSGGFFQKISNALNPVGNLGAKKQVFETQREQLYQRVNQVKGSLMSMNLRAIVLNTEELVELLYNSYNLDMSSPIRIKDIEGLELTKTN
jgi:type IV secretory pathway VirB4 component